jgi:hypothetical protein
MKLCSSYVWGKRASDATTYATRQLTRLPCNVRKRRKIRTLVVITSPTQLC